MSPWRGMKVVRARQNRVPFPRINQGNKLMEGRVEVAVLFSERGDPPGKRIISKESDDVVGENSYAKKKNSLKNSTPKKSSTKNGSFFLFNSRTDLTFFDSARHPSFRHLPSVLSTVPSF